MFPTFASKSSFRNFVSKLWVRYLLCFHVAGHTFNIAAFHMTTRLVVCTLPTLKYESARAHGRSVQHERIFPNLQVFQPYVGVLVVQRVRTFIRNEVVVKAVQVVVKVIRPVAFLEQ